MARVTRVELVHSDDTDTDAVHIDIDGLDSTTSEGAGNILSNAIHAATVHLSVEDAEQLRDAIDRALVELREDD